MNRLFGRRKPKVTKHNNMTVIDFPRSVKPGYDHYYLDVYDLQHVPQVESMVRLMGGSILRTQFVHELSEFPAHLALKISLPKDYRIIRWIRTQLGQPDGSHPMDALAVDDD